MVILFIIMQPPLCKRFQRRKRSVFRRANFPFSVWSPSELCLFRKRRWHWSEPGGRWRELSVLLKGNCKIHLALITREGSHSGLPQECSYLLPYSLPTLCRFKFVTTSKAHLKFFFSLCAECPILKEASSEHYTTNRTTVCHWFSICIVLQLCFTPRAYNCLRKQEATRPPVGSHSLQHVSRSRTVTLCFNSNQPNQNIFQPHRETVDDRSRGPSHLVLSFLTFCRALCLLSSQPRPFLHLWPCTCPSGSAWGSAPSVWSAASPDPPLSPGPSFSSLQDEESNHRCSAANI